MSGSKSDWLECSVTKARLNAVESILTSYVDTSNNRFNDLALHTVRKGGKYLRPSLYLLALNTGGFYDSGLLHPAAALELIHIASLHHDDVMDQADLRRNSVSVNAAYGNLNATYSGNYLFAKAVSILSGYSMVINQVTCNYISDLCLGQLKEAENAYNLNLSPEVHLEIIEKKTASLFELPCHIGAILSGADTKTRNALLTYGKNVGIAFQLIDDLLDLKGNVNKMGKKGGTDLKEGVYTYATLYALHTQNGAAPLSDILLIEDLKDHDIEEAIAIIDKSGGLQLSRKKAEAYMVKGLDALAILPAGSTKASLVNLAKFILARDH